VRRVVCEAQTTATKKGHDSGLIAVIKLEEMYQKIFEGMNALHCPGSVSSQTGIY